MSTATLTLTDFLLARIAEDERTAHRATASPWTVDDCGSVVAEVDEHEPLIVVTNIDDEDAVHITRHDPARVLAECEAKRRIVEHLMRPSGLWTARNPILLAIATVYADHPDYRAEWWRP